MALKKFTRLLPSDWEAIRKYDSFYEKGKVNRRRTRVSRKDESNPIKLISIERSSPGKMYRNFCSCGNVSNSENSKCPICGNESSLNIEIYAGCSRTSILDTYSIELNILNEIDCKRNSIFIEEVGDEFVFSYEENILEGKVKENEIDGFTGRGEDFSNYAIEDIVKVYPYDLEGLEVWDIYRTNKTVGFKTYLEAKKNYPSLMASLKDYPKVISSALYKPASYINSKTTIKEVFDEGIKCPDESFYPYINKIFAELRYDAFNSWRYSHISLEIFKDWSSIKTEEMERALKYILGHSSFNAVDIATLIKKVIDVAKNDLEEKILAKFILSNYIIFGTNVVNEYVKKKTFLDANKIPVTEETLEKKNYNTVKNQKHLESLGYNPKRAQLFLNAFELDPISSLQYLESKRMPSKKLLQEIADKLDDKYS